MKISEVRVAALIYTVSYSEINFLAINENGDSQHFCAGTTHNLQSKIDNLHEELSDHLAIAKSNPPHLNNFIDTWGKQLLPPVEWFVNIDVVVIVQEGCLHGIPLHLVRFGKEYLGTLVGITYSSSTSLFSKCVNRNPVRNSNTTDINFEGGGFSKKPQKKIDAIVGGVDVLGDQNNVFKDIVSQIGEYIQGDVINFSSDESSSINEFSRTTLKSVFKRSEKVNILCVVAHGYIDYNNHRMSGLILAKDKMGLILRNIPLHGGRYFDFRDLPLRNIPLELEPKIDSEILTSAELEIDGVLDSELVLLLGCSTASGRIFPGDEPASLAETFLHIGASSVIASSWDLDSEFAKEWNSFFFEGWLKNKLPKALAYRQAMQKLNIAPWNEKPEQLGCVILKGDWL